MTILSAQSHKSHAWPQLVLRAVIVFVPVSIAVSFVLSFVFALLHDQSFQFFGFEVLG